MKDLEYYTHVHQDHDNIMYTTTEVIVGLTQPEYLVTEGETVMVCAQLQSGQLGRDVTVYFVTSSDLGNFTVCDVHNIQLSHKPVHFSFSDCNHDM